MSVVKSGPPDQTAIGSGAFLVPAGCYPTSSRRSKHGQERNHLRKADYYQGKRLGSLSAGHKVLCKTATFNLSVDKPREVIFRWEKLNRAMQSRGACTRSPAHHLRPIKPPHRANSSSKACLNEPGAFMPVCPSGTGKRVHFPVYRSRDMNPVNVNRQGADTARQYRSLRRRIRT
jgi:hypothetical protein